MASPTFTINGSAITSSVSVAASATVTCTLVNTDGVRSCVWTIAATDDSGTPASYTLVQSGNVGQTATCTALTAGTSARVSVTINAGLDPQTEQPSTAMTASGKFYVALASGGQVLNAGEFGDDNAESSSTHGAVAPFNAIVRAVGDLSIGPKLPCRVATTANHGLSGLSAVDGVTPVAGDRILVRSQSTGSANGIYVAASGAWTRASDFNASADVTAGSTVYVDAGSTYARSQFVLTSSNPITLGSSTITFARDCSSSDKTTLDAATSSASNSALVLRDGSAGALFAAVGGTSFATTASNPSGSGLLRAANNTVVASARNAANGANIALVQTDGSNNVIVGDNSNGANVYAKMATGGGFYVTANATDIFKATSSQIVTALVQHASAAGDDSSITGQRGASGFNGGTLTVGGGAPGTSGTNLAGAFQVELGVLNGSGNSAEHRLMVNGTTVWREYITSTSYMVLQTVGKALTIDSAGGSLILQANGTVHCDGVTSWDARVNGTTRFEGNTTGVGFNGSAPIAKPAITGSRGGNAALADLLTKLASYGLITDSTSA